MMLIVMVWVFLTDLIPGWSDKPYWDSVRELGGLCTTFLVIAALFFGDFFIPEHLKKTTGDTAGKSEEAENKRT